MFPRHPLALPLLLVACKGDPNGMTKDDTGSDDTGNPSAGCIPYTGTSAIEDVHAEAEILVADAWGQAQSTLDEEGSPLPYHAPTVLLRTACGEAGIIVRLPEPDGLYYVDLTSGPGTPELVSRDTSPLNDVVTHADILCDPVVIFPDPPNGYAEVVRKKGTWSAPISIPVTGAVGETPQHLSHKESWTSIDGDVHVTALILTDDWWILHGERSAEGEWSFETAPTPAGIDRVGAARVDEDGGFHVLYSRTEYPCEPCDLNIYHGYRPSGGDWTETVVEGTVWGDPDDRFATDPTLALSPEGVPVVVAAWQHRVVTGSLVAQELRAYAPLDEAWCHEVLAATSDGYEGGNGSAFTGANPRIDFDPLGRPHVLFSDTSQWHDDQGWANAVDGQLRHAVLGADGWNLHTLIEQPGQTVSPEPLQGFDNPLIAFSSDGSRFTAGGLAWSWDTGSVYNDGPAPIHWTVTLVEASIDTGR